MSRQSPLLGRGSSSQASTIKRPAETKPDTHYTVLIRLPFPRHDFVEPAQVEWDASKEKKLWKILSQASGGNVINCESLAARRNSSLTRSRAGDVRTVKLVGCTCSPLPGPIISMFLFHSSCSSLPGCMSGSCLKCEHR